MTNSYFWEGREHYTNTISGLFLVSEDLAVLSLPTCITTDSKIGIILEMYI